MITSALAKNIKTAEKLHDNLPQEERAAPRVALSYIKIFCFLTQKDYFCKDK